ncbi:MAG: tRNA 2-thiouridine(34) synthase MnmA [Acidobacteriota bacterium]
MRIAMLLSGGVDSSVALHRLLASEVAELGPVAPGDILACYLKIWLEDELSFLGDCPWDEDLDYVRAVCRSAGVELAVVPLQRPYRQLVIEDALGELRAGRTPSPDILCNRRIKFGAFSERLEELGDFDRIASGHYARTRRRGDGTSELLRGVDPVKDQTYFLHRLEQRQVQRLVFPLGDLEKAEVRRRADELGLPNRTRRDSQGLCFLGGVDFNDFVRAHLGDRPGPIREVETGAVLGEHRGHWFHTIGQRRGLGLGGGPWFVVGKDVDADTLWVRHGDRLQSGGDGGRFVATSLHWIGEPPSAERGHVRIRHGPGLAGARFCPRGADLEIRLDAEDPGIAPGQAAVIYAGEICLGGGWVA